MGVVVKEKKSIIVHKNVRTYIRLNLHSI